MLRVGQILQNDIFVPNMGAVKTKPNYKFEPVKIYITRAILTRSIHVKHVLT